MSDPEAECAEMLLKADSVLPRFGIVDAVLGFTGGLLIHCIIPAFMLHMVRSPCERTISVVDVVWIEGSGSSRHL